MAILLMLYLPFNVYIDSKKVSILIEAVLQTLPMLYHPFNVYLDSKSILIEAVLPTLHQCCTFPLTSRINVYLDSSNLNTVYVPSIGPTVYVGAYYRSSFEGKNSGGQANIYGQYLQKNIATTKYIFCPIRASGNV